MNKIKMVIMTFALALLCQSVVSAMPNANISGQKVINKNSAKQAKISNFDALEKINLLVDRYYSNLRTCEPLHIEQAYDIFGLKFGLKVDINGWNKDKCEYRLGVNLDSLGKDIREVYNVKVTDEQLAKIKPVVECNFTKEQLNLIVDAIIARNQRNTELMREMLQNPNEKYVKYSKENQKLSKEEEKMLISLLGSNACTVPNKDELINQITEIMNKQ